MEAWPIDSTKRSRLGQMGSSGSKRRKGCQRQEGAGAMARGVPGGPELAACTASMDRVGMVLMHWSSFCNCSFMVSPHGSPRITTRGLGSHLRNRLLHQRPQFGQARRHVRAEVDAQDAPAAVRQHLEV